MNINTICKITLTTKGAEWANKYNSEKLQSFSNSNYHFDLDILEKIYPTNLKSNDILELSLWEIMVIFGKYFDICTDAPFVNNEINFMV